MKLPVLHITNSDNIEQFIEYWSLLYYYPKDSFYFESIVKSKFEREDIKSLFEWKNGMPLEGSGGKERSLNNKILPEIKISKINAFKEQSIFDLNSFLEEFKELSAVWKIFLLHVTRPIEYPIYDQHIHRAFCFIHGQDWENINEKISNKKKELFYHEQYLPFVTSLNYNNLKKMDEAFFAFGQFLSIKKQRNLLV
jgi:hypothetical protein